MKKITLLFLFIAITLLCAFKIYHAPIQKLSLDMLVRTLQQGKSVTAKGQVFYRTEGGLMVTHFDAPFDVISITNAFGEYKNYDIKSNTVLLLQGEDYSTKNSFFYFYLTGKTQDMGLSKFGYRLSDTKILDKTIVSSWLPPESLAAKVGKAEIAHENNRTLFIGFYNVKGLAVQKTYYSNYQQIGNLHVPLSITEITFTSEKDSVISRRLYSNPKINEAVDNYYLNFKIPSNAKVVKN